MVLIDRVWYVVLLDRAWITVLIELKIGEKLPSPPKVHRDNEQTWLFLGGFLLRVMRTRGDIVLLTSWAFAHFSAEPSEKLNAVILMFTACA